MREIVHTFGRQDRLVGIVTVAAEKKGHQPVVLLLNSGLLPRTGPFRLHVTLARALASRGFMVLRFDLSGVGDSEKHSDTRTYEDQHVGDVQDAMDFVSEIYGCQDFVLMGICTGADNAHKVAAIDPRVKGAVFIEGYAYRTWLYYVRRYASRVFRLESWLNRIKGFIRRSETEDTILDPRSIGYYFITPPKQKTASELRQMISRGMRLYFIYTGSNEKYLYQQQLRDAFPEVNFGDCLKVELMENATHTFQFAKGRKPLIENLCQWMSFNFRC